MSCIDRLVALDILSLETIRLQTDLVTVYKIMHDLVNILFESVRLQLCANVTRGAGLQIVPQVCKEIICCRCI